MSIVNSSLKEESSRILSPRNQGRAEAAQARMLTPEARNFVAALARKFEPARRELLEKRRKRQRDLDGGALPDFLSETRSIRESDWKVAAIPADLRDRRIEITGPVDRKMVINALNSGANVFMADFEDANSPTWENCLEGQLNLHDAIRREIAYDAPGGKSYRLHESPATLMVRPRGWHLVEKHFLVDGESVSASLFDFGLFFFHNAAELLARGSGPYFYLPKLESHLEARLWNDVFLYSQEALGIPRGSVRATVLIETILAAFEMDEILYELREHSAGLNCGRWDYIFSFIKKFRARAEFVLPDRAQVTMTRPFLNSYVELLIHTCHRRGIHAMGGMAAQVPIKNDPKANDAAIGKVREDKLREVRLGHDGTWVAHPGLVAVAKAVFDEHMRGENQLDRLREDVHVSGADLIEAPDGTITEEGLRWNIDVCLQYLEAWLRGSGCVPIYHLMEDAATAEICRAQIWQWIRHGAHLSGGQTVTSVLARQFLDEQMNTLREQVGTERFDAGKFREAADIFAQLSEADEFPEFLTLAAYDHLD
jgi:malate synthase